MTLSSLHQRAVKVKSLAEKATAGPWEVKIPGQRGYYFIPASKEREIQNLDDGVDGGTVTLADAAFISNAPAMAALISEFDALAARQDEELEALRKDAERYRWARVIGLTESVFTGLITERERYVEEDELDAAIDAAIAKEKAR